MPFTKEHSYLQLETTYSTEKNEKPGAVSHKISQWRKFQKTGLTKFD